jgi:hypothetical protein
MCDHFDGYEDAYYSMKEKREGSVMTEQDIKNLKYKTMYKFILVHTTGMDDVFYLFESNTANFETYCPDDESNKVSPNMQKLVNHFKIDFTEYSNEYLEVYSIDDFQTVIP